MNIIQALGSRSVRLDNYIQESTSTMLISSGVGETMLSYNLVNL